MKILSIISFLILIIFSSCNKKVELIENSILEYEVEKVVDYEGIIWSIEFLEEDDIIRET